MKNRKKIYSEDLLLKGAFCLFGIIPITSERIEAFVAILFCGIVLIDGLISINLNKLTKPNRLFVFNGLLFLVLLITLFDGVDILALKKLEQMFSLLVFPVTSYFLCFQTKVKTKVLFELWKKVFFTATVVFSFIAFYLISQYSNPRYPNFDSNFFQNAIIDNSYFTRHPAYVSIFICVAILIGFSWVFKSRKRRGIILPSLFVLFLLLIMLSVKIALISITLSLAAYLYFCLKKGQFIIGALLTAIIISGFVLYAPNKYNRFSKLFDSNVLNENTQYNSVLVHKLTILCAYELFKDNMLMGVGVENAKANVDSCVRKKYSHNPEVVYNSHNQYLGYALYSGVFGLGSLLVVLLMAVIKSYKYNKLLFVLILLYCVFFLTENVLERQSGIVLFAFLLNMVPLFLQTNLIRTESHELGYK